MDDPTKEKLETLIEQLDNLNDKLFIAVLHTDGKAMDRIGRDLISLGQSIKDTAYNIGREVRG